jgi:23S rRNA (uridine2552-2'-O)-methyltransferase
MSALFPLSVALPTMSRSKSSSRWLREHFDDVYVKKAQAEGLRSRAVFKLEELVDRDRLLKPHMSVVDLGAAPGGWSQLVRKRLGDTGKVIALDILPMQGLGGVDFIQGDFREEAVLHELENHLQGEKVDLVLSDMAPNMSGVALADQIRAMDLADLALDFSRHWLKPGGAFLIKLFQGAGFDEYLRNLRAEFSRVTMRKPKASRARSREVYALAVGLKSGGRAPGENRA